MNIHIYLSLQKFTCDFFYQLPFFDFNCFVKPVLISPYFNTNLLQSDSYALERGLFYVGGVGRYLQIFKNHR